MFKNIKIFLHHIFIGVPAIYNYSYHDKCYIPEIHDKRYSSCHSSISKLVEKEENND